MLIRREIRSKNDVDVAGHAVLPVLAGPVLAAVAIGNGGVALVGALAAKAHPLTKFAEYRPGLTSERRQAPPAPEADAGGRHLGRAALDALAIQEVPPVTAPAADVSGDSPVAVVAVVVETAAALPLQRARLDHTGAAADAQHAPPADTEPVLVAREAASRGPTRATTSLWRPAVPRARCGRRGRSGRRAWLGGGRGWSRGHGRLRNGWGPSRRLCRWQRRGRGGRGQGWGRGRGRGGLGGCRGSGRGRGRGR